MGSVPVVVPSSVTYHAPTPLTRKDVPHLSKSFRSESKTIIVEEGKITQRKNYRSAAPRSVHRKRARDDVAQVGREVRCRCDALERGLGAASAHRLSARQLGTPSSGARRPAIRLVEAEREGREKVVAGAVRTVELGLIQLRNEPTSARTRFGLVAWNAGMLQQDLHASRRGIGNGGLQREPFVDDERVGRIAPIEIVDAGLPLRHRMDGERGQPAAIRSVNVGGGLVILARRERDGGGGAGRGQEGRARHS